MCGLFSLAKSASEVREHFSYQELEDFPPRPYVAPGGPIAIIRNDLQSRHFALVRWGFIPSWVKEPKPGKPLINARSETVTELPSFRSAFKRRRCLVPTDGWYEWHGAQKGAKQPYKVSRRDGNIFAMAGIWEHWLAVDGSEIETAAILTTAANDDLAAIHHRMPVTIAEHDYDRWLECDETSRNNLAALMTPADDGLFVAEKTIMERRAPAKAKPQATASENPQLKLF